MNNDTYTNVMHEFLTLWNITDEEARRETARRIFSADFRYVDVHTPQQVHGLDAFLAVPKGFRQFAPDAEVQASELIQSHHDVGRIAFNIMRDSKHYSSGMFFMEFDEQQKISKIIGFID
jgi:hypothetical protein